MGGHNPLEPAVLQRAVLAGPHRANSAGAFEAILAAQGFGTVTTSADIAREAARLIADPETAHAAGAAAARGAASQAGAVARTLEALGPMFKANADT